MTATPHGEHRPAKPRRTRAKAASGARRLGLASRTLAALLGGYALANALPVALLALLGVARAPAALAALQLAFLVYLLAVIWSFAAPSARAAWFGLLLPAAASLLLAWQVLR